MEEAQIFFGNPQGSWISNTIQICHALSIISFIVHVFCGFSVCVRRIFPIGVRCDILVCSSGAAAPLRRTRVSQLGPAASGNLGARHIDSHGMKSDSDNL